MKEIKELKKGYIFDSEFVEGWIENKVDVRENLTIDALVTISAIDNCDLGKKFFLVYDAPICCKETSFLPFQL